MLIDVSSKLTSEVWFVPTDAPDTRRVVVAPREHGHEYGVEHHWSEERGDRFLIVTNHGGNARNFELVAAPCVDPERAVLDPARPAPRRRQARLGRRVRRAPRAQRARQRLASASA